jgi:hypothetical protein
MGFQINFRTINSKGDVIDANKTINKKINADIAIVKNIWESRIDSNQNIVVKIDVKFASPIEDDGLVGKNTLGVTSIESKFYEDTTLFEVLQFFASASKSKNDDLAIQNLKAINAKGFNPNIHLTRANAKAIGLTVLDIPADAEITINKNNNWDYRQIIL